MARTPESIVALITEATSQGFRNDLLAKGQARSMIWRKGLLPADAPSFSELLSYDLLSYAYALMTQGLRLLDSGEQVESARSAFENAAAAIEAVIARGSSDNDSDFHRLIAGACYHLARYSARAFSLLHNGLQNANLSRPERALGLLLLRDLDGLEALIADMRLSGQATDATLVDTLGGMEYTFSPSAAADEDEEPDERLFDIVDLALADNFMGALGTVMFAFERGEREHLDTGIARLRVGLASSGEFNLVPQWWCHRLTIHLLGDLWSSSFHEQLPRVPPEGGLKDWSEYRDLFIASLFRRRRAEIDLWPSQLEAARRALELNSNMVVSLPTSAGKTRVAELCILACLAAGRRVVFVTPLRALSAQTEVSLQHTFRPLGKTVSTLYGAIGVGEIDEDVLRESDIIVATPEKLDFALRNDPDLINDVGLVVLDEGHMIGLTEREVRYEVQIQRLLRRDDAVGRRIVCLSAILPDGKQLEDFTAWLTQDQVGGLVKRDWRPTRLRFGEVVWKGDHARLDISIGAEQPWIERFLTPQLPQGRRRRQYPSDQRELCIATAWALIAEAHTVLIFCPLRSSVEPFAKAIVDLAKRGAVRSVLEHDAAILDNALAIGAEWLGAESPILSCLRLGVAIHHGALPTPFRREIERLLRDGVLKVTICSPTLAQGLNLSATTLIFHGLMRDRAQIDIAEFRNVVGRAGRAYVDVEGLVLLPMFEKIQARRAAWKEMIESAKGKEMESGLLRLVRFLVQRMIKKHKPQSVEAMLDYLTGNVTWECPALPLESADVAAVEQDRWEGYLTTLDTAILSMLGELDVADADIESTLDEVLASSLWARRLRERTEESRRMLNSTLVARARHIWGMTSSSQRRGYFVAGVGLETGRMLDEAAPEFNQLLVTANEAILVGDDDLAIHAVTAFADKAFRIKPFSPDNPPAHWREILDAWLRGDTIASVAAGQEDGVLRFVEQALVYKLAWAMEAVRVRAIANGDTLKDGLGIEGLELRMAVASVETGTLNRSAAILMHAGFSSRIAAISAVRRSAATFTRINEMREWLREDGVAARAQDPDWPTTESHGLWTQFIEGLRQAPRHSWKRREIRSEVLWNGEQGQPGTPVRLHDSDQGTLVLDADFTLRGRLKSPINARRRGLVKARVGGDPTYLEITYLGPRDLEAS